MDPIDVMRDIVNENLDRLIVARLEQDLEMVTGYDVVLEAALIRVIKFLGGAAEPYDSHDAGESYES